MSPRAQGYVLGFLLLLLGIGLVTYKSLSLQLPVTPGAYQTIWTIEAKVEFSALGEPVMVSLALPKAQSNMEVLDEIFSSSGYGFTVEETDGHERAIWTTRRAQGPQALYYKLDVHRLPGLAQITLPDMTREVRATEWVGSRRAAVRAAAEALIEESWANSADKSTFVTQIIRAFNDLDNDNARLIRTSLEEQSRVSILLDLLATADIPAHILRGIYLEDDRSRISPAALIEIHDGEAWQVFSPTSGSMGLPDDFLIWQRGDKSLLDVEGGRRSRVSFSILANNVPQRDVSLRQMGDETAALIDFSIYSLPIEQQSIFKFILLVPVGALIVILMRVIVGVRTAGTFMPVLLAIAFVQTDLLNGVAIFLLILVVGIWVRSLLSRLDMLLVARIAAVVVLVVSLMAVISIVSYRLGIEQALTVTFFPMIIIAWTIEHMSILWEDDGPMEVFIQTTGSLVVAILCFFVMTNHYVEHWMFNFPELLLALLGFIIILGQYTGYRFSEMIRFRHMQRS